MQFIKKHFKPFLISITLILLLSACGTKKAEQSDAILHQPAQMEAPAAASPQMKSAEEKKDKKKILKKKSDENDDMERTD